MRALELLSPARDREVALTAIRHGADAVYIGGPGFGARRAAGNSLESITEVIRQAHRYYCKVYVTVNTLLYDHELKEAEELIRALYRLEADAVIVQDPGILRLDIPPIPLHASTQMHNYEPERIRFLDRIGFRRIVLARELSLEQIRTIRREVSAELEYFVHGALCVGLSGQCYLSQYLSGRSANRGECMQACRQRWSLTDADGQVLIRDKHLLSLKDLNLSEHLPELVEAGIDSFKIEGRLKEADYVANVTHYYRQRLDLLIDSQSALSRASSGRVSGNFDSDPQRSFNRGFTTYFLYGRTREQSQPDTPKSMGKAVARVAECRENRLRVVASEALHNGDGLCYLSEGELRGIRVNRAEGEWLWLPTAVRIPAGTQLYRNYDHQFVRNLEQGEVQRKIALTITGFWQGEEIALTATDADGISATLRSTGEYVPARQPEAMRDSLFHNLARCGDTPFVCDRVDWTGEAVPFLRNSEINGLRRNLLSSLEEARAAQRPRLIQAPFAADVPYEGPTDWRLNVANHLAAAFYSGHGAEQVEQAFEIAPPGEGVLLKSRFCLLYEMGWCRRQKKNISLKFPLFLTNRTRKMSLSFDCDQCFMSLNIC